MYMNLKPNQHERISFNARTITSLGFIDPPLNLAPPKLNFLPSSPPKKKLEGGGLLPCWSMFQISIDHNLC